MSRTKSLVLAAVVASALLVGAGAYAFTQTDDAEGQSDERPALTANWLSDTGRNITGNHHVAVGGQVGNRSLVFAPISGTAPNGAGHDHDHRATSSNDSSAASDAAAMSLSSSVPPFRMSMKAAPEGEVGVEARA